MDDEFANGDSVEFWSGDRGGCWKPGTVDKVYHNSRGRDATVRMHVGNGVHVSRPSSKCRRRPGMIRIVPGSSPPVFRWKSVITDPTGQTRVIEHTGSLPQFVEDAVADVIRTAERLVAENAKLRSDLEAMAERVAAQSELLSKKAEKVEQPTVVKKGK